MGVSTDAILCFGFTLDDDDGAWLPRFLEERGADDLENLILGDWKTRQSIPLEERKRRLEECPIDLVTHCHAESPMWIVAVRGTTMYASGGCPTVVYFCDPNILSEEKVIAARKFCKQIGIEWKEPRWLLASYWG